MGTLMTGPAGAAPTQSVTLKECLGQAWPDELISYPLAEGMREAKAVRAVDEAGAALPCQLDNGRVHLQVSLPPDTTKTFTFTAADSAESPANPATVTTDGGFLVLDSGVMAVRLPAGQQTWDPPAAPADVPGPLAGVRLGRQGAWIGKSWLEVPAKVTARAVTVEAEGPLFCQAAVAYSFEGGRHYRLSVRVIAGQPYAVINESMDLNPGGRYVLLKYDNDADASTWEWWNLADGEHLLPGEGIREQPANAVFSFRDNLDPNQCRWTGGRPSHPRKGVDAEGKPTIMGESGELYAPLTYDQDERFNRLTGWWLNSFSDRSYAFSLINDARPDTPVVSLLMGRPSRNVNPHMDPPPEPWVRIVTGLNDLRIWTMKDRDVRVLAPVCLGTREWLLMLEPQSALRPKGDKGLSNAFRTVLRHSWFPLDKVKDWSFEWPEPEPAWPRLFCQAGDLQAMKDRVAAATGEMAKSHLIPAIYKANGTPEAMAKQAMESLERAVRAALCADGHGSINWFHASLHMMQVMPLFEAAMATPGIDPATRARLKAYGAFVAHRAWDDDYWPPKETANGWGSANMGTLAAGARVLAAAAMAGHPDQARWLARSRGYLDGNLLGLIADDGSGLSCPHYLGASTDPVLYMALALKYGGGYNVFKEDPRWARFCQFMIDILTPPDPRSPLGGHQFGLPLGAPSDPAARNRRNLWPLGHTSRTETTGILDMLALGMQGVDDRLAGALRTMSAEMGATSSGAFVAYALLSNTTSPLAPPDLRSRHYPAYGAILRDRQPAETWLAIHYSKFAFDHVQASDTGTFTLFAKGAPLMMDFGSMYSPECGQAVYHNRVAWDIREGDPRPCPGNQTEGCFYRGLTYFEHTVEPWTCRIESYGHGRSPLDAFGEITDFASLPGADWLAGRTEVKTLQTTPYFADTPAALAPDPNQRRVIESVPPFDWERQILFAKPARDDEPLFVLVRDDFTAPCPPPTVSYWVMASDLQMLGRQAHATGQFGIDLDLYAALPAEPALSRWQWEHKNWGGERQLCLRVSQPQAGPFLVALFPRKAADPAPVIEPLAAGNAVRVTVPQAAGEAWVCHGVLTAGEPMTVADGEIRIEARAAALLRRAGQIRLSLPAGGRATTGEMTVESDGALTLTAEAEAGPSPSPTSGRAQAVRLTGRMSRRPTVTLDGAKAKATVRRGTIELQVPAGDHTVQVAGRR